MNVDAILSGKSKDILTVTPDQTIADAVSILGEKKIGALVVVNAEGVVEGILSERDVVRGLSAGGAATLDNKVSSLMTVKVEVCSREDSIDTIMREMSEGRFRHMPVVEAGKLVGVVSIGDVVNNKIKALQNEAEALRDYVMS